MLGERTMEALSTFPEILLMEMESGFDQERLLEAWWPSGQILIGRLSRELLMLPFPFGHWRELRRCERMTVVTALTC